MNETYITRGEIRNTYKILDGILQRRDLVERTNLKIKLSHYTARRRWGGERRYSSYSFSTSALDGVSGQRHASAAL
jgi:hypothetical protein